MENMNKKVKRMARGNARRKLWHRAVAIPAAIVVFVTTYALILPAIAMERDTYCGLEAHQHTAECYTAELACGYEDGATVQDVQLVTELACGASAHQHTADCYDETGAVICGYADYLVHEHTADCYAADGTLVCPLPQVEAHTHDENCYIDETVNVCGMAESEGHIHTADCYSLVSHPELVCGMAESAGHIHTADCYTTRENTYLACGMAESAGHIHGEGCYVTTVAEDGTETTELVCTEPESMGHTHTEACYATETVTELTCGQAESAGHTHTDACWANVETLELTCGQAESAGHTHTDACYATQKRLVCPKPEVILHTHNDDCYTVTVAEDGTENRELTCTQTVIEEHVHTADCFHTYEQTIERPHEHTDLCYIQTLTCTLPEHEHTEECYVAPETPEVPETPEYICGLQGHTHTELCYDEAGELICGLEEHVHDETCLPVEIADGEPVEMGGEPDGNVQIVEDDTPAFQMPVLACGLAEHEHSTSCMDENMNYVCGLTAHAHTGDCYEIPGLAGVTPELVCDKHEHFHTEACYNENGEIACGLDEHTHGVGCFALPEGVADPDAAEPAIDENIYWCGFEAHEHTEACLDANGETVCGLPEHQHTEACLVEPTWYCGCEPHTHGEGCFDETGALVCVLPEHTHSDACKTAPEVFCGLDAHVHGASCYGEDGALICGLEEHVHTADCKVQHFTQMAYADGVMVTASYTSEAGFPLDAVLQVTRFTEGEHYEDRVNEASEVFYAANPDQLFQPQALLNIGFYLPDGTEVEPLVPVEVTVQLLGADGLAEGEQYTVIHYGEAGTELLDADHGDAAVNFSAESFSDFMISYDMDPSDGGSTVADGDESEGEGENSGSSSTGEAVPPINWGNFLVGSSTKSYASSSGYAYSTISGSGSVTNYEHNKYIDYLGDNNSSGQNNNDTTADEQSVTDDLYRLYLDMEGESEPVDLVIVIDRSNSMKEKMESGKSRWQTVYDILEGTQDNGHDGLLYEFLKDNTGKPASEQNYVSVVWFAGRYGSVAFTQWGCVEDYEKTAPNASTEGGTVFDWTSSYTRHGTTNYSISPHIGVSGGVACTNYVAGLWQADQKLRDEAVVDNGHRKVVVFMSDGIPVYYYKSDDMSWSNPSNMKRYGLGNEGYTYHDYHNDYGTIRLIADFNGWTDYAKAADVTKFYQSPYFKETLNIFNTGTNSFVARNPNISFHTVAIDLAEEKLNGLDRTTLLKDMAASYTGGTMYSATTASGLKKYLQSIMFPAGVTISDDLSQYVELYGTLPDIKVTATNKKTGAVTLLWSYMGGEFNSSGPITGEYPKDGDFEGTAYTNIVESVTYDADTSTIAVKFKDDYCLSSEYTYTLSFNVKLTDAAYNAYADYLNKNDKTYNGVSGEPGTDYTGTSNGTSSSKPGLHSNDKATVTYKIGDPNNEDDSDGGTLEYKHPVVQAWASQFRVKKDVMAGYDYTGIQFQLQNKDGTAVSEWKTPDESTGYIDFGFLHCGEYRLVEKIPEWFDSTGADVERQKIWLEFTVDKGRIVEVKPYDASYGDDVQYVDSEETYLVNGEELHVSELDVMKFETTVNSKPNTAYNGEAYAQVVNKPLMKPLEIYKADESDENKLGGAKFSLQKYDETKIGEERWTKVTADELRAMGVTENQIETETGYLVSDSNGLVFKGGLPYGRYRLCEEQSPLNYDRSGDYVYFKVTEEDGIQLTDKDGTVLQPDDGTYKDFAKLEKTEGVVDTMVLTIMDTPTEVKWQLKKTNDTTVPLPGAAFSLYGPYDEPPATTFDPETDGSDKLIYKGETEGKDGLLVGTGAYESKDLPTLIAGKYYYLVEDQAPAGFNRLDKPIQLHAVETEKGKMELHATLGTGTPLTVVSEETKDAEGNVESTLYTVTVQNTTGYELPESGGIGTTVYTLSGLAMLALAGAMFCANRRKSRT